MAEGLQVKICGLTRREDVLVADEAGADFVGVIMSSGFGRSVPSAQAGGLVMGVQATPVAVTVNEAPKDAAALALALGAGVVQLHGNESVEDIRRLKELGGWDVWKAVRVRQADDLAGAAERYHGVADALLVEGWKEGVVGGGGARADLALLEEMRGDVPADLPLVLAGGLTPDTVAEAVARIRPWVVDVSSGVEEGIGTKSASLIQRFVAEARRGPQFTKGVSDS